MQRSVEVGEDPVPREFTDPTRFHARCSKSRLEPGVRVVPGTIHRAHVWSGSTPTCTDHLSVPCIEGGGFRAVPGASGREPIYRIHVLTSCL